MFTNQFIFIFLLASVASVSFCLTNTQLQLQLDQNDAASEEYGNQPKVRTKRGAFWDFFQKIVTTKNLVGDQFSDTKNTLNEVYNLLNEGFSDPAPTKPTLPSSTTEKDSVSSSDEDDMSTTTEPYLISRYELGRILGRNFRGLQRLTRIELQDAFNQSHYNIAEYRAEARKQFANSIAVEKKKKFESFKG